MSTSMVSVHIVRGAWKMRGTFSLGAHLWRLVGGNLGCGTILRRLSMIRHPFQSWSSLLWTDWMITNERGLLCYCGVCGMQGMGSYGSKSIHGQHRSFMELTHACMSRPRVIGYPSKFRPHRIYPRHPLPGRNLRLGS